MKIIKENSNKYRRVRRALFGDPSGKIKTFAIISPENPLGWEKSTDEEFKKKYNLWLQNKGVYNKNARSQVELDVNAIRDRLRLSGDKTLKFGAFSFAKIKGHYGDKENSIIVFNIPYKDAEIIARDYGQESFFYGKTSDAGENSTIGYYETSNGCATYNRLGVSNVISNEDEATDFFSKFGFKFRINLAMFGDDVPNIDVPDNFEESMNENRSFMSRAIMRRRI